LFKNIRNFVDYFRRSFFSSIVVSGKISLIYKSDPRRLRQPAMTNWIVRADNSEKNQCYFSVIFSEEEESSFNAKSVAVNQIYTPTLTRAHDAFVVYFEPLSSMFRATTEFRNVNIIINKMKKKSSSRRYMSVMNSTLNVILCNF